MPVHAPVWPACHRLSGTGPADTFAGEGGSGNRPTYRIGRWPREAGTAGFCPGEVTYCAGPLEGPPLGRAGSEERDAGRRIRCRVGGRTAGVGKAMLRDDLRPLPGIRDVPDCALDGQHAMAGQEDGIGVRRPAGSRGRGTERGERLVRSARHLGLIGSDPERCLFMRRPARHVTVCRVWDSGRFRRRGV